MKALSKWSFSKENKPEMVFFSEMEWVIRSLKVYIWKLVGGFVLYNLIGLV